MRDISDQGLWRPLGMPFAFLLLVYLAFRARIDARLGFWGEVEPRLIGHGGQEPVEAKAASGRDSLSAQNN